MLLGEISCSKKGRDHFGVVKLALNVVLSSADKLLVEVDDSELSKLV